MREREVTVLLELLPLPVRVFDSSGMLQRRNTLATAEDANMRGSSLRDYWERDQPREIATDEPIGWSDWPGARAFAGETQRDRQMIVVRRHLRRVVSMSAGPILDDNNHVIGVVIVEQELSAMSVDSDSARDDRARRLAAVGQLASGVMHDVNNALNPIMAAAFLLDRHAHNPAAVRDYAERIRQISEAAARTTARVGRFIRQQPMSVLAGSSVALDELVDGIVAKVQSTGTHHVDVQRVSSDKLMTHGAANELRDAIEHLLQNATESMPNGGTIRVRTQMEGNLACVQVHDSGAGMTAEAMDRAFEPFFSTKGSGHLGLGLAEVYGIARRHRGDVQLESDHTGTTVTLCVPRYTEATQAPQRATPVVPLRVLVVEDHDEGREFLERVLTSEGHFVDAVRSCAAARDRVLNASATPPYDVMITDVGLPDGSGWELVSEVRNAHPQVTVGVLSGYEPTAQAVDQRGAAFVLHKPLRATELLAQIGAHVDSRT